MSDVEEIHLALRARLVTVAELPTARGWESVDFVPPLDVPSIDDAIGPVTFRLLSATAASGATIAVGLYIVRIHGIANQGDAPIREISTAIVNAFPNGASMTLDSGDSLRIEGEGGISVSQILPVGKNKVQQTLQIPWLVYSRNPATLSLAS